MRWPWVSREWYEDVRSSRASVCVQLDNLRERYDEQVRLNRELTKLIVEMKRDGFTPKPQAPDPLELSDPLDDEIAARAKGNPGLRRHLLSQKALLRQGGTGDDEIRAKLIEWQDPERDD